MYEVVGCGDCGTLWVHEGDTETTTCRGCRRRIATEKLRTLATAKTVEEARELRSRLLAERAADGDLVAGYGETATAADAAGMPDDDYLSAMGVDLAEVEAAGEAPESRRRGTDAEIVLETVATLEEATRGAVRSEAAERGVDEVEQVLERLTAAGEITVEGGTYRRL